jgi:hypothetical protein
MRVEKRGPATPRPIAEGLAHPWEIAVDAQAVYVTVTRDGRVLRLPSEGGAPIALAESQGEPMGTALGGLHVYWARRRPGTVARAPRRGGAVQVLASGLAGPDGLAVDAEAGHAYWTDWEDGAVRRFEMQRPGPTPTVVSRGHRHPNGIAVDRGVVYFTTALRDGSAFRVDRDDSVHLLSRDPAGLVRIVTDERRVWWTTEHRSTVLTGLERPRRRAVPRAISGLGPRPRTCQPTDSRAIMPTPSHPSAFPEPSPVAGPSRMVSGRRVLLLIAAAVIGSLALIYFVARAQEERRKVERAFTARIADRPNDAGAHLGRGRARLARGAFAEAEADLREALRLDPSLAAQIEPLLGRARARSRK